MRRLLVVALLLAGLCAPPAVLAQIGGAPGITTPVSLNNTTFTGTTLFGSGTCAGTSSVPFTGGVPGMAFSADTDSGLCWDTAGGVAGSIGPAFMKDGRQVLRLNRAGGVLFGHNTSGTVKTRSMSWDSAGGVLYGWDFTGGAEALIASWAYDTANTPEKGYFLLGTNVGLLFQGTTLDATQTWVTVTNPTGVRQFNLPDFSGTALVSSTANEPDTGNAVWANTGSFLFEGPTANAFETELDVVEPTADNVIYLPDSSGTVLVARAITADIADTGDGNPGTYELDPEGANLALLTCLDTDGCTLIMAETGAVAGQSVVVVQAAAGSGNITLADDDGTTTELDADSSLVFNTLDSLTLTFTGAYWLQTAYTDIS